MKLFLMFIIIFIPIHVFSKDRDMIEKDRIVGAFIKEMNKKQFTLFGLGGAFMYDIEEIGLDFDTIKQVDINEARRLIVDAVENLLNKINNDIKIRPYLHNYPFTHENLNFVIGFKDKKGKLVLPPHIAQVTARFGKVTFSLEDVNNDMYFKRIHQETYEEALKIYQSEKLKT